MPTLAKSVDKPNRSDSRRFIVNLMAVEGKQPQVRSCELIHERSRNRTSFSHDVSIVEVFRSEIARGINVCLQKLSLQETEILSLPDLRLEVPGLLLQGAQVAATMKPDDTVNIILRFKTLIGGIGSAFRSDMGLFDSIGDQNSRVATRVLSDIAMPLLNLCLIAETESIECSGRTVDFYRNLIDNSHELKFQVELLKRFVNYDISRPALHSLES